MFAIPGVLLLAIGAIAAPSSNGELNIVEKGDEILVWKDTPMETVVRGFRAECLQQSDSAACIKAKVLNLLDNVLRKNSSEVTDSVSNVPNDNQVNETSSARSFQGVFDQFESYLKGHDLTASTEDDNETIAERGRKSKLKKILVPIFVFVLLKAMTLIPLAIGVLSLKAWNALQLSFISFLVSISLAIFQLCKKVAAESHSGIAAHIPFETSHYAAARNFIVDQQRNVVQNVADINDPKNLAYRAYAQMQVS